MGRALLKAGVLAALCLCAGFLSRLYGGEKERSPLRIAVAANLNGCMQELAARFRESHPGIAVDIIPGSSGKLAAQILSGAPFDLFLSADRTFPEQLYRAGLTAGAPVLYAAGGIALFSPRPLPSGAGLESLRSPAVRRIVVADPALAPYGKAAIEALRNAGLYETLAPKLVYAKNVAEVVGMTLAGADAGFTAASFAASPEMQELRGNGACCVPVDARLYRPVEQAMVLLSRAGGRKEAAELFAFLRSKEAREILRSHGYGDPHE